MWLEKSGLILNFIGTIMIAYSVGENLSGAYQNDEKGKKVFLASFKHPKIFKLGMFLLAIGFILQIIS